MLTSKILELFLFSGHEVDSFNELLLKVIILIFKCIMKYMYIFIQNFTHINRISPLDIPISAYHLFLV